ncbi:MAG: SusC/RagA family TonB-linked outer membrane protein, partial [Chitinophagaceae bacterium]|nr:SusC/RagA family TonB-linked outer membrane protein [Chitinophagaceae bacterium]
ALGIKKEKKALGYAVSSIKGDELLKAGATMNPFLALYGKAAGVGVNTGAAGPEGGLKINIRGAASLNPNQNTRPLFVVDGVIIGDRTTSIGGSTGAGYDYGSNINDINSSDIESIDILKGAKATVLYGTDAANGVVLITTKSGKGAKGLGVSGSFQATMERPKSYLDLQTEYGLGDNIYDTIYGKRNGSTVRLIPNKRWSFGPKFDGSDVMFSDSTMHKNLPHDSYDGLFRTGSSYNSNVAIAGSNDKGSLRASYTNYKYNDIISPNSWQKRNTFSFNGSIKASKFATFDLVSNIYNIVSQNRRGSNAGSVAWGYPADYDYNDAYRNLYLDGTGYKRTLDNYATPPSFAQFGQYMWNLDKNRVKDDKFHMVTSAKLTLNFSKHVFLSNQFGLDYDNTNYTTETSVDRIIPKTTGGGFAAIKENNTIQNYQSLLNYTGDFKEGNLHLNVYGGGIYRLRTAETIGVATIGGLRFPDWYSLNNQAGTVTSQNFGQGRSFSRGSDVLYSAVASANLAWRSEIIFEAQARQDWNSTLPPGNNRYFFPGASVTWNYTDRFKIKGMNNGQFRFSWADVGNGTNRYFANNLYSLGYLSGNGIDAITVAPPSRILPGALKPERKREFEVGINNSFFKGNRLTLDFSYYTNNRYNQIISLPVSNTSSSNGLLINAGNMRSWGFEFQVVGTPILKNDLRWNITLNGAQQNSKVLDLYGSLKDYNWGNLINGNGAYIAANVGEQFGNIKMLDYVRDNSGNRVVNGSGVYSLQAANPVTAGNIMPKVYGGALSDLSYKNFSFRIGLDYKYGGTVFSYTNERMTGLGQLASTLQYRDEQHGGMAYYIDKNGQKIALASHTATAPATSVDGRVYHDGLILPGVKSDGNGGYLKNDILISASTYYQTYANDLATSFPPDALFKNNYIKLREVALSYNIPSALLRRIKVQRLSVTLAARNLFYLYKSIPNIDAEAALGADSYVENTVYPGQQTYSLGFNITF